MRYGLSASAYPEFQFSAFSIEGSGQYVGVKNKTEDVQNEVQ